MTQPRASQPTIGFIDQYSSQDQSIFPEVRSYEAFKRILIGIITPSQRKSLSRIAKIVGLVSTCQAELESYLAAHPDWQIKSSWKSMLNNVQLLLVPLLAFNLVKPW